VNAGSASIAAQSTRPVGRSPKPKRRKLETKWERQPGYIPSHPDDPFGMLLIERYSRIPGTGTIGPVTRKGYPYLRWRGYVKNAKGVRERRELYGKTASELQKKIKKLQESPAQVNAKKLLLGDFLTERFLPAVKLRAKPKTYAGYEQAIRLHIVPDIGKVKLTELTANNVVAWLKDLDAKPRAKQNAFVTLKVGLNHAVSDPELSIDRSPIDRMEAPRAEKAEQHILPLAEIKKLLATSRNHFAPWHALLHIAIATSMRQGELFALTWRDVDLKQGFVYIRQGVGTVYDDQTESGYRREITSPKTGAASRRRIDLSPEAITMLKGHRKQQSGPNVRDLVFPNEAGSFIHASNFNRRVWQPLLKKAKLPRVTFHSLRHSGNSILAQQGLSLPLLQQRLGHSTPTVTIAIYSHVGAEEGRKGAALIGSLLSGAKPGATRATEASKRRVSIKKKA